MVPADSRRVSRDPRYSGCRGAEEWLRVRGYHPLRPDFPEGSARLPPRLPRPCNPARALRRARFGLFPGRSPLLGESLLFSLPAGTKMFQFPAFAPPNNGGASANAGGLPHSETRGSKAGCASPRLVAASHVLHRLLEPRHPPCALNYFRAPRHQPRLRSRTPDYLAGRRALVLSSVAVLCASMSKIVCPWASPGRVENIGLEPMASCMPCKRSSQLS